MIISWVKIQWISDVKGYGLVAAQDIPKGTIIYVQDGLDIVIPEENVKQLDSKLLDYVEKYSYEDYMGNRIICWDLGKYMNHDDHACTLSTGYGFEIAIRDIKKGEEVTDDYRIFSTHHDTDFSRGPQKLEDLSPWPNELIDSWNEKIKEALLEIENVKQPLIHFVDKDILQSAKDFKKNPRSYRCISDALPLRYKLLTKDPRA